MFRVLFAGALAVVIGAMLDWIGALWSVAQNVYQQIYGKPMPHAKGNTLDHVNDWLAFLPTDPGTRAAIVAGTVVGLLTITFVANVMGIGYSRIRRAQHFKAEAQARTIGSYRKVR